MSSFRCCDDKTESETGSSTCIGLPCQMQCMHLVRSEIFQGSSSLQDYAYCHLRSATNLFIAAICSISTWPRGVKQTVDDPVGRRRSSPFLMRLRTRKPVVLLCPTNHPEGLPPSISIGRHISPKHEAHRNRYVSLSRSVSSSFTKKTSWPHHLIMQVADALFSTIQRASCRFHNALASLQTSLRTIFSLIYERHSIQCV